jgi:hypothetical protein
MGVNASVVHGRPPGLGARQRPKPSVTFEVIRSQSRRLPLSPSWISPLSAFIRSQTLEAEEVVQAYKDLSEVEKSSRIMKGFALEVGPIRHQLERRVRAHVSLCMLARYVRWHMEEALAPPPAHGSRSRGGRGSPNLCRSPGPAF